MRSIIRIVLSVFLTVVCCPVCTLGSQTIAVFPCPFPVHLYLCIVSHTDFFVVMAKFFQPWSLITSNATRFKQTQQKYRAWIHRTPRLCKKMDRQLTYMAAPHRSLKWFHLEGDCHAWNIIFYENGLWLAIIVLYCITIGREKCL